MTCVAGIALALGAAGCGDSSDPAPEAATATGATTSTAMPSSTPPPKRTDDVRGIDVYRMGRARAELVEICAARAKDAAVRNDEKLNGRLRKAAATLITDFHANPDERFRLTPKAASISMRTRLISLRPLLRRRCGEGVSVSISTRMGIAIRSEPERSSS